MRQLRSDREGASTGDEALRVNNDGKGSVSAEWLIPKAGWIAENEPDLFSKQIEG